jgi:hypothetical protein
MPPTAADKPKKKVTFRLPGEPAPAPKREPKQEQDRKDKKDKKKKMTGAHPHVDQVMLALNKRGVKEMRESLRNKVCVTPDYPGRPEDYRYVAHFCVKKGDPNAPPKPPKQTISAADTAREVRILEKAIAAYGKDYREPDIEGSNINTMRYVFEYMVKLDARKKFPDPLKRYEYAVDFVKKGHAASGKSNVEAAIPRYTVLQLVLAAMKRLIA